MPKFVDGSFPRPPISVSVIPAVIKFRAPMSSRISPPFFSRTSLFRSSRRIRSPLIPRNQPRCTLWTSINIFPGKNVGSAPGRGAGKGRARGCTEGDILSESFLDIDSIHFQVSSRFLLLYSLIFNLSPGSFIAFFVSPSSSSRPESEGRRRMDSREYNR